MAEGIQVRIYRPMVGIENEKSERMKRPEEDLSHMIFMAPKKDGTVFVKAPGKDPFYVPADKLMNMAKRLKAKEENKK